MQVDKRNLEEGSGEIAHADAAATLSAAPNSNSGSQRSPSEEADAECGRDEKADTPKVAQDPDPAEEPAARDHSPCDGGIPGEDNTGKECDRDETGHDEKPASDPSKSHVDNAVETTDVSGVLAGLADRIDAIEAQLTDLRTAQEERWRSDQFREEQVQNLHTELQQYKVDFIGRALKPVLTALIQLHTEASRLVEGIAARSTDTIETSEAADILNGFQEELETVLSYQGVAIFRDEERGNIFNPKRQQVLKSVEVHDETLHGQIAERKRPGFERAGKLLQKERVNVYVKAARDAKPSE